jgi:hypothetical protein
MVRQEIESIGYLPCAYKMQQNAAQPASGGISCMPCSCIDIWPFSGYFVRARSGLVSQPSCQPRAWTSVHGTDLVSP